MAAAGKQRCGPIDVAACSPVHARDKVPMLFAHPVALRSPTSLRLTTDNQPTLAGIVRRALHRAGAAVRRFGTSTKTISKQILKEK